MNKILISFLLLFLNIPLFSQINTNGIPFLHNFSPGDYNAAEQNWTICEDKRGVIYIGNNDDGILEFNGTTWIKIPISNGSIIRALIYANDGIVYVGGVREFGYLEPDIQGKMHYKSLSIQLDSIDFNDVWKVFNIENDVYFCSEKVIYKYRDKQLKNTYRNSDGAFLSFNVNDKIYWGNYYENGLFTLEEDSVVPAIGGDFYKETDIFIMLPWGNNEILIYTVQKGFFIYNKITGLSKSLISLGENFKNLDQFLSNSQIYNGIKLSDGNYALATLNNGCIIFNEQGNIIYKLDKSNGLQDITIINLFEAKDGNLWLALNKGISFIELKTPFTKFGQEYGMKGIISDLLRYNDLLFVSTNIDLYFLDYDEKSFPYFKRIPLDPYVFNMEIFIDPVTGKKKLLFATHLGIWELIDENTEPAYISDEEYKSDFIYQSKFFPERLYVGHSKGVAVLDYINGNWNDKGNIGNITNYIQTIVEDNEGNLWLGTALNGIIKLKKDNSIKRYDLKSGLPDLKDCKVYNINNEIVCATNKGIYVHNNETEKFKKYTGMGEKYYHSSDPIKKIFQNNNNEYWVIANNPVTNNEYIEKINIAQDRIVTIDNLPFKRLLKNSFQQITFDDDGIWIAGTDGIYHYKEKLTDEFLKNYYNLITKVEVGIDSIIFWGTFYNDTSDYIVDIEQPKELIKTLPYQQNSFQFYYSSPSFPNNNLKYSFKLKGFERDWSTWDTKTEKGYTNLNEGDYIFMVKAKNIYDIESEIVEYKFTIKPPWYRTILAIVVYGIFAIFIIIVIVKIYTRRLELEKIRLEQIVKERTEEVVKQKDEIEKQRDTIADKNRSITDSIEYASRIQTAVLPSEEYAKEILPEHFILFRPRDIVSGDFYWMTKKDNLLVIIAADCTGHGVPGAFMSMLGVSFLNEIVNRHEITSANAILNSLRADVKKTLGQEGKEGEAKDGMDLALCLIDFDKMKMQYAGAYNPLYLFRNNELLETKADRMPIGIFIKEKESFTNNEIDLKKGDIFYLFSDGFQDQFGGEDGRKFKTKNFKELLLKIHQKPMLEQREILNTTIDKWRGRWEQIDDIIVMGIRV